MPEQKGNQPGNQPERQGQGTQTDRPNRESEVGKTGTERQATPNPRTGEQGGDRENVETGTNRQNENIETGQTGGGSNI
jgi:hypothetical protein